MRNVQQINPISTGTDFCLDKLNLRGLYSILQSAEEDACPDIMAQFLPDLVHNCHNFRQAG
jgi:hypothetical protein